MSLVARPMSHLFPFDSRGIEAVTMVLDVATAIDAASTHVPELLTWRERRERDFCGELSPPRHQLNHTSWPHKHEDRRERCQ